MGTRTAAGVQPVAKILVVDDDPLVRFVTADHLQDAGFEVVEAPSADCALPLLEAGDGIAALVTDVQMPGSMNGLELAQIVRRRWPSLPIVVVSGYAPPQLGTVPAGATFLTKPYDPDELLRCLAALPGEQGH